MISEQLEKELAGRVSATEREGGETALLAESLAALSAFYREEGRYLDAEAPLVRSLAICEKIFAADHSSAGARRRELAQLYQTLARYGEAEALILKSQQVHGKSMEPQRMTLALDFRDMAELYRAMKRWTEAESVLAWARELAGVLTSDSHAQMAEIPRSEGHVAVDQNRWEEAERRYAEAEYLLERLPIENPQRLDLLEDRAHLAQLQGRFNTAEDMLRQVLRVAQKAVGPFHPRAARVYYAFGLLAQARKKEAKARGFFEKCFEIQERSLALFHPDKAQTLMRLADGIGKGKPTRAEGLYEQALDICERAYGPRHPQVAVCLNNLANLYYDKEYYKEAEAALIRSIDIYKTVFGEKHPEVVPSLYNLVALYDAQDRYDKVVALLKQVVDIVEQKSSAPQEAPEGQPQ